MTHGPLLLFNTTVHNMLLEKHEFTQIDYCATNKFGLILVHFQDPPKVLNIPYSLLHHIVTLHIGIDKCHMPQGEIKIAGMKIRQKSFRKITLQAFQ